MSNIENLTIEPRPEAQADQPQQIVETTQTRDRAAEILLEATLRPMKDAYLSKPGQPEWYEVEKEIRKMLAKSENADLRITLANMREPRVLPFDGNTLKIVEAGAPQEDRLCDSTEVDSKTRGIGRGARSMTREEYQVFAAEFPVDLIPVHTPKKTYGAWLSTFDGSCRHFGYRKRSGAGAQIEAESLKCKHYARAILEIH